jgi:hypothetical protein
MTVNSTLVGGMALISPNGQYKAIMQANGNFVVIYANTQYTLTLWSTATSGNAGAYLSFQNDANLVIWSSANVYKWASNVYGSFNTSLLTLKM